ncbi:peroxidase 27-like [Euphorbia lathyris]|uniref:peroxidase 27-like n=1 Tax=Euphorbia lathyris TaxID=212925 RepID=UPI0033140C8A
MKALLLVLVLVIGVCEGGNLRKHFYRKTCPQAEDIIRNITWSHVATNPVLPAKFLRMHFHDCFVRGCDGSVLIDSTTNSIAEKDSIPNLSLTGFDVIEDIKSAVEKACPGIVSCADILALAARDSVSFMGKKPLWKVLTGRRDGKISLASEVFGNIPSPFSNFSTLLQDFKNKKLTVHDLVVLSGGHSIGVAHCNVFSNRLYNFTGRGDQDPSLDAKYAAFLKTKCQTLTDTTTTVDLDPRTPLTFDKDYYVILKQNKGLLQSDATLLTTKISRNIVGELTNSAKFFTEFAQSMVRMGAIQVLTGTQGEIRNKCNLINS